MYLLAPTVLRIEPSELRATVRARFGNDLRRAGLFAELGLLGARECLQQAGGGESFAMLWASERGALQAGRAALDDGLARGEPAMPFTFIATQPHLAAVFLAQQSLSVTRLAHLHLESDRWTDLLQLARVWLHDSDRVLLGWVEEAGPNTAAHRSDWCLLQRQPAPAAMRCEPVPGGADVPACADNWLTRIATWQPAASAPLVLKGRTDAWRFSAT